MTNFVESLYQFECHLFRKMNRYYNSKIASLYFRVVTHLGGATSTILTVLLFVFFSSGSVRLVSLSSAVALAVSHIPVQIVKKLFPRKRPYLVLKEIHVTKNPLQDHSFPSGHTTAIFSVLIPFILFKSFSLIAIGLLLLGISVAVSRIVLGLHYPSDVVIGGILGGLSGYFSYSFMITTVLF
ncbi:phosphatase PAP2 family protein [Bacillus andreraoultii]|uniref:phosphatase PAP2 family protein n=1 Tax=Bacillus andreraoultii TaxID=1499685 RepID=UPI00053A44D7|nr:phosphatase PAP2 family protein [Bacillus andreraoultii]